MEQRIFDFLDRKLSPQEREQFLKDIESDGELRHMYAAILTVRGLEAFITRPEELLQSRYGYKDFVKRNSSRRLKRGLLRGAGYAASVLLVAAVSWLGVTNYRLSRPAEISYNTVSVPAGQRVSLTLNDGSVVWLNSMSKLVYPTGFAGDERCVRLEGEAYFEVAKDASKPFVVKGPKVDVKVLGTKFNLQDYVEKPAAIVNLVEGAVEVSDAGYNTRTVLLPNQMVKYMNGYMVVSEMANHDSLLWRDGVYSFQRATLAQIAEMLEAYYDVRIVIENPAILKYEYTGKFRQQDGVYEILRILQQFYRFSVERVDSTRTVIIR